MLKSDNGERIAWASRRARRFQRAILSLAAALLAASAAKAGEIATPLLFLGGTDQLVCIANNVGTESVKLKVKLVGNETTTAESCTLPAGDRAGCQHFLNDQSGFCVISSNQLSTPDLKKQVRGVMFTRSITAPFAIEAVVQAE